MKLQKEQASLEKVREPVLISSTPRDDPQTPNENKQLEDISVLCTHVNPEITKAIIKAAYGQGLATMTWQKTSSR